MNLDIQAYIYKISESSFILLFFLLRIIRQAFHIHNDRNSSQDPLPWRVTSLQLRSKHISRISLLSLVGRTLVDRLVLLALGGQRQGLAVDNRNDREHLLGTRLFDKTSSNVPSGSLQDETIDIGAILRHIVDLLNGLLSDICLDVQFVELDAGSTALLVRSSSDDLLDGSEVGLRVEESGDHDDLGQVERVVPESVELLDSLKKVDDPSLETSSARIGQVRPHQRHPVDDQRVHSLLHFFGDCEQTLDTLVDFFDGPCDFSEEDGHIFYFLDEDVLVGPFLVGVHFVLDLIDREDHALDVDILNEALNHRLQYVLSRTTSALTSRTAVLGRDLQQSAEKDVTLSSPETDLRVRMQAVGKRRLGAEGFDMFQILFIVGGEGDLETDIFAIDEGEQLLLLENGGIHHVFKVSLSEPAVPVVDDVPAVHDLAENVDQILKGNLR